jgi:hypothetical protein
MSPKNRTRISSGGHPGCSGGPHLAARSAASNRKAVAGPHTNSAGQDARPLFGGSGCRAATTPPRLRGAEATSLNADISSKNRSAVWSDQVASAAQARAAAEPLARSARFVALPTTAHIIVDM